MSKLDELLSVLREAKERGAKTAPVAPAPVPERRNPNVDRFGFLHAEPEFREGTSREIEIPEGTRELQRQARSIDRSKNEGKGVLVGRVVRATAYARRNYQHLDPLEATARAIHDVYRDRDTASWYTKSIERDLSSNISQEGGYLIPTQAQDDLIELLYPMCPAMQLGATEVPCESESMTMPYVKQGTTAEYLGTGDETETSDVEFGEASWKVQKLGTIVAINNDVANSKSARADLIVARDLARQAAIRMNKAIFQDDGSLNRPRGLLYENGLIDVNLSGSDFSPDDVPAIFAELADQNMDLETMLAPAWCMSHRFWEYLQKLKNLDGSYYYRSTGFDYAQSGGAASPKNAQSWEGYPKKVTQLILSSGSGPYTTTLFYGDWSEYLILRKGMMSISSSTEAAYKVGGVMKSAFQSDKTLLRLLDNHGLGMRQKKAMARVSVRYTR